MRKFFYFFIIMISIGVYPIFASGSEDECFGIKTPIINKGPLTLVICHAPYTKIEKTRLAEWQNCDDAIFMLVEKIPGNDRWTKLAECEVTMNRQFKVKKDTFFLLHYFMQYPGFNEIPMLVETYNIRTKARLFKITGKLESIQKPDVDKAIQAIDAEIKKPFDGNTYFDSVYGGFFKLRRYALRDPDFSLSILKKYEESGKFDGEVSETLSGIVSEVELISKAVDVRNHALSKRPDNAAHHALTSRLPAGGGFTISASSSLKSSGGIKYIAENVNDHKNFTAWVEGKTGYGIGEYLLFTYDFLKIERPDFQLDQIILQNGYCKSPALWKANSRVKRLSVYFNGDLHVTLNLKDSNEKQVLEIPNIALQGNKIHTIKIKIEDIYKGTKYKDTAISELYLTEDSGDGVK